MSLKISIPVDLLIDFETSEVSLNGFPMALQKSGYDQLKNLVTQRLTDSIKSSIENGAKKEVKTILAISKKPMTKGEISSRMTEWWAQRKASGLCISCDNKVYKDSNRDYSFCSAHLVEARKRAARARRIGKKKWAAKRAA